MANNKTYQLAFVYAGKAETILEGTAAFLQWKKQQLMKEPQFSKGRFTIISLPGMTYNLKNTLKP